MGLRLLEQISLAWVRLLEHKYLLLEQDLFYHRSEQLQDIFFDFANSPRITTLSSNAFSQIFANPTPNEKKKFFKERLRMEPHCLIQFQCWSSVCFNLWKTVPFPLMWTLNRTDWKTQMVFYICVCARAHVPACALLLYFSPFFEVRKGRHSLLCYAATILFWYCFTSYLILNLRF